MAVWHQQFQIAQFICQDETLQSLIIHCDKVNLPLKTQRNPFERMAKHPFIWLIPQRMKQ